MCGGGYGHIDWNDEERDKIWSDLDKFVERVGNRYRLCMLGDLKEWVEDKVRVGITGAL